MELEEAIGFLESIIGKTVYLIEINEGKVEPGIYNLILFDEDYFQQFTDDIIEGTIELTKWCYRNIRDYEHYVLYYSFID